MIEVKKRKISFDVVSNLLEESPNVESTTTITEADSEDDIAEPEEKLELVSPKSSSQPEEIYQKEIDILLKLFPQRDKVGGSNKVTSRDDDI